MHEPTKADRQARIDRLARMQHAPADRLPDVGVLRTMLALRRHEAWGAQRDRHKLTKVRRL